LSALDFNNHFLNQIIYHSIQDDEFLNKIRHIVPLDIFKTRDKQFLIKIIFDYYDQYKMPPKDNFYDIFYEHEKSMGDELYQRCMSLIGILKDIKGSNPDYILTKINDGIRHFKLEEASVEFASLIKRGKYDNAKGIILKAMKEPSIEAPYYNYFEDRSFINDRLQDSRYKMKTQIDKLDEIIGGYRSSWLITLLGATKGGKTWFLIETAVRAVLQSLNVLFISLEMGKEQIDERFDMTVGFMTSNKNGEQLEVMEKTQGNWHTIKKDVDTIYDIDKVIKERQRFCKVSGGDLQIVAFNRGRINYHDIDRILDELEETKGFFTDVVVVDYLGIMKETVEGQNKKERISENCIGLKEMAGKRNLVMVSAMQGNRQAMKAKVFHSYLVADDIDTIFNSDLVLALCQTDAEERHNKYRIYVANYRHGKQHGSVGVIRDLTRGQIALDTYDLTELKNDEEEIGSDY
jgi:hypothetical protein